MAADAKRMITELRELAELTGDERGAQRLAWTDTWAKAREWERELLAELPVEVDRDEAGNMWATLAGDSPQFLIIGSHIDSVPNGGWLDGCLGVLSALEVLRSLSADGPPPLTVKLVDWADEEGARFGLSLLGSMATAGQHDADFVRGLRDADGVSAADALAAHGVDVDRMGESTPRLAGAVAYIELHIEQGPVLEARDLPLGVVTGTYGTERWAVKFTGQAAHSGSTPMDQRRDALSAAARLALEVRELARTRGGVGTVGRIDAEPGIPTAVAGVATALVDQRHVDAATLAELHDAVVEASHRIADEEKRGGRVVAALPGRADPLRRGHGRGGRRDRHRPPRSRRPPAERAAARRRARGGSRRPDRDAVRAQQARTLAYPRGGHRRGRPGARPNCP